MKIGVIQASSPKGKNEILYRCTKNAAEKRGHEVINFGIFSDESEEYSYVETALLVSLLLSSRAVDFVVTGCSSGQGMMLACNSLPGVLCGYVQNPQDAFLFGRINGGNAVSFPLGLNFGWLGEINLQYTLDKLFDGEFGIGYPPEDADRKREDTKLLKALNNITKRTLEECFALYPPDVIKKVSGRKIIMDYVRENGQMNGDEVVLKLHLK